MTRLIHTQSKIFFSDPKVVMLEHEKENSWEFSKLTRKTYKAIQGTWGHTTPQYERASSVEGISIHSSLHRLNALFDKDSKLRSYWCFQSELDELQFRLMIGEKAQRVYMWPERLFTIHEVVEEEG